MSNLEQYVSPPTEVPAAELISVMDSSERANVDIQIVTAKRYPRNLKRSIENAIVMATLDVETADKMGYALNRGGKPITGPSVHLAKLIVAQYGNMRIDARVIAINEREVVSRGMAWDLESNNAYAVEVRRSIIGKNGRFSDDMITVTGNAANAIALRNAVFAVIPGAIVDKVYRAAQQTITGDLSDENKLIQSREKAIKYFNEQYGITEEEVIKLCGKYTKAQICASEIALLRGMMQALRDGDTTVEDLMSPIRNSKEAKSSKLTEMASRAAAKGAKKPTAKPAEGSEDAAKETVDTETGEVKTTDSGEPMQAPNPQI